MSPLSGFRPILASRAMKSGNTLKTQDTLFILCIHEEREFWAFLCAIVCKSCHVSPMSW